MNVDAIQSQLRHLIQKHKALIERKKNDQENEMLDREIFKIREEISTLSSKQRSVLENLRKEIKQPNITQHISAKLISKAHSTSKSLIGYTTENHLLSKRRITDLRRNVHYTNDQDVQQMPHAAQNNLITSVNSVQKVIPAMPKLISTPRRIHDDDCRNQTLSLNGGNVPSAFMVTNKDAMKSANTMRAKIINDSDTNNGADGRGISSVGIVTNSLRQNSSPLMRSTNSLHGFTNNESSRLDRNYSERDTNYENESSRNFVRLNEEKHSVAKLQYMAKLGLILPENAREIERKRDERKRRSKTQGLSSSQEAYQKGQQGISSGIPLKRGRGRPPKISTSRPPISPNEISSSVPLSPQALNSINKINTSHRAQRGRPRKRPLPDEDSSDEEVNEQDDVCCVCNKGGELLICDTCNSVYHLRCLDPPLSSIPDGMWMCPDCHAKGDNISDEWPGILVVVHSYLKYKAATEVEKNKINMNIHRLKEKIQRLEDEAVILSNEVVNKVNTTTDLKKRCRKLESNYQNLYGIIQDLKGRL
ncbi:uncharacterized protein TRIADDRAFT_61645 [Trichoplax adhaerens]|uniref:PHD-type domain-containing protein n=1 Tax=Trichoplax adhaerens TaxID=10228 RepID=B3SBK2_TRIAD|nr:hypothetical protein TRIADDRAFT_61645 [Trichoplax adhaerens]EDV19903.1 hypothetical protein TRIADDRAFT_61645 [Trichoplax adhaerens]|eukprot:XP_002117645.1 hypothetical protein TRIADDRAFT_61645 [Trichoplax adhaerens]